MSCTRKGPVPRLLLLLIITMMSGIVGADIVVKDTLGNTVHLPRPAMRIVSLAPHNTENLFAAGAGNRLVGATLYSDYPPDAKKVPRVGGYTGVDLEAVVALKPDLILAWESGNKKSDIERLRSLGFPIFISEPRRLEQIADEIESLGELAGTLSVARRFATRFRERLQRLRLRHADLPSVRVFYELWHRPLMTINGEQLISQAIALCGGRNIFDHLPALAATIDIEAVLAADPEAIIIPVQHPTAERKRKESWQRWPQLRAVTLDSIFFVPSDLLHRQGPRILEGTRLLCSAIDEAREKARAPAKTKGTTP